MKVLYLPHHPEGINPHLTFAGAVRNLIMYARKDFERAKRQYNFPVFGTCPNCQKGPTPFEIHHTIPMWAYAVDLLLDYRPTTAKFISELSSMAFNGEIHICKCNERSNLIALCERCHEKAESEAGKHWKDYFRQYRISFTNQEIREQSKRISQ